MPLYLARKQVPRTARLMVKITLLKMIFELYFLPSTPLHTHTDHPCKGWGEICLHLCWHKTQKPAKSRFFPKFMANTELGKEGNRFFYTSNQRIGEFLYSGYLQRSDESIWMDFYLCSIKREARTVKRGRGVAGLLFREFKGQEVCSCSGINLFVGTQSLFQLAVISCF